MTLVADDSVVPLIEPWIPLGVARASAPSSPASDILVRAHANTPVSARLAFDSRDGDAPLLRLGSARALRQSHGRIALFGQSATQGQLSLESQRAVIDIKHDGR